MNALLTKYKTGFKNRLQRFAGGRIVGKRVVLANSSLEKHISIGQDCYLFNTSVGAFTYLAKNVSVMNTEIGRFCSIAQGVCISLGVHPSRTFVSSSPVFFSPYKQCGTTFSDGSYFSEMRQTKIGNDVWIGVNAILMDGITVGDGAIIGAGAIVTKDVPPYAIVGGNPARIIRYRFDEEAINFLLEFRWWNKNSKWLQQNFKDFHDIKLFINKYKNQ